MKTAKTHPMDFITEAESVILHIEGLQANDNGTFTMEKVQPARIDYESVVDLLRTAGIDEKDAGMLTEEFAQNVFRHTMARQLAERMRQAF